MKMNKSFSSWLSTMAIVAGLAGTSFAQNKFVDASEFGRTLGRAKKDHHIEVNYFGGSFGFEHAVGFSVAYSYIVNDGLGEINMPLTLHSDNKFPIDANTENPALIADGAGNFAIGTGLKYRKFQDKIDEGLFYGGGMRIWFITSKWTNIKSTGHQYQFEYSYQNFSPLAEVGYTIKLATEYGLKFSGEFGGSFSTFDELNNVNNGIVVANTLGETKETPTGDPGRSPVLDYTGVHYAINLGVFYAF